MKYLLATVLCLTVGPISWAGIQEDIVDPYVEVQTGKGLGSGTVIKVGDETLVLTAAHVIASLKTTKTTTLIGEDGKEKKEVEPTWNKATLVKKTKKTKIEVKATVVWVSPDEESGGNDLALLRPEDLTGLGVAVFDPKVNLELGEDAWYIGSTMGEHRQLEKSIIQDTDRYLDRFDKPWVLTNGNGAWGNSGGGLFVKRGGRYILVGVICRVYYVYDPPYVWKGALLAQTPITVGQFIESYQKGKK